MILIFCAHQDDELFIFPLILDQAKAKKKLKIIYTTNGSYGNFTEDQRRAEAKNVIKFFNLDVDQVFLGHELGVTDSDVISHMDVLCATIEKVCEPFMECIDSVFVTGYEGGHHDHDATYLIVSKWLSKRAPEKMISEYFLYNCEFVGKPFFNVMKCPRHSENSEFIVPFKHAVATLVATFLYRTQFKTFLGLGAQFFWRLFVVRRVGLRLRKPGLSFEDGYIGAPLYERRGRFLYLNFQKICKNFLIS